MGSTGRCRGWAWTLRSPRNYVSSRASIFKRITSRLYSPLLTTRVTTTWTTHLATVAATRRRRRQSIVKETTVVTSPVTILPPRLLIPSRSLPRTVGSPSLNRQHNSHCPSYRINMARLFTSLQATSILYSFLFKSFSESLHNNNNNMHNMTHHFSTQLCINLLIL